MLVGRLEPQKLFVLAGALLALLHFPIHASGKEAARLRPRPLISATADETEQRVRKIEAKAKNICGELQADVEAYSSLSRRLERLKQATRRPGPSYAELLEAAQSESATNLPSAPDLAASDLTVRKVAEKKLSEAAAAKIDELSLQASERLAALQQSAAQKAQKKTNEECDAEICGRRILGKCKAELRVADEGRVGGVGVAAGVSWLSDTLVPGAAKFLSERAESETELWLSSTFQSRLCGPKVRAWFPNLCSLRDTLSGKGYQVPGTLFASAVREDLESLPLLLAAKKLDIKPSAVADALTMLLVQSREGESPLALIAAIQHAIPADVCEKDKTSFACRLQWASALVELAGDAATANESQVNASIDSYARALVKAASARCPKADSGCQVPSENAAKTLLLAVNTLVRRLRELSSAGRAESSTNQRGVEIASLSMGVLDSALSAYAWSGSAEQCQADADRWPCVRRAMAVSAKLMRGDYVDGTRDLVGVATDWGIDIPEDLKPYVSLVADLAAARDPSEVKAALDTAAAPVGSWRVKRREFTVSVTSLVGGTAGYESPVDAGGREGSPTGGLMATLGLDLAWPVGSHTVGFYVSALDVGQLVSAPIAPDEHSKTGDSSEADAGGEFKAVQIFSPGAYLRLGLGNSPFTLGAGASLAPKLRLYRDYEDDSQVGDTQLTMVRVQGFFAVDVTLLPF